MSSGLTTQGSVSLISPSFWLFPKTS